MSIDGVFIHHLVDELKKIENKRINKIYDLSEREFIFNLSSRDVLVASLNLNHAHLRLSTESFEKSTEPSGFCMILRKYFERSIIKEISQYNNDRIIIISVEQADELGYRQIRYLIFELIGRHANLILTDENYQIIDCLRKTPFDSLRLLVPKVTYVFPLSDKINPFIPTNEVVDIDKLEGLSNILKNEINSENSLESVLYRKVNPTIIISNDRYFFYWCDLKTLNGKRLHFESLSSLLDYYFIKLTKDFRQKEHHKKLINYLKREIKKTSQKINKQKNELETANQNLIFEKYGNLLSSNLYLISKGDETIVVEDFYNDNKLIELKLDPLISPSRNLENYFNKYKKARRTIDFLSAEITKSQHHLQYLQTLKEQVLVGVDQDLNEIAIELGIQKQHRKKKSPTKPNYLTFSDEENNLIYVGKNNIQNNYLTHTLANRDDYFFHVKNAPGSHVIVRTNNLTEQLIILAAHLAAYYSNCLSKTQVDYTLVKYVKKIKGVDGSFVIYTNEKSIMVNPDQEYFSNHLTLVSHDK